MPTALSDEELDILIERFDALVGRSLQRAVRAGTSKALTAAGVEGPQHVDSEGELHTGAMIALVPKDPENWVLAGGEAADSLHVTLAYLGDSDNIPDHVVDALYEAINNLAAHLSPINAEIFGANIWNPDSDSPSLNAAIGGSNVDLVHNYIQRVILFEVDEDLEWAPPENHSPWNAHMCLAYGNTETLKNKLEDALKLVGPITFDRVRFAQGGESTDYFLHDAEVEDDPAEMVAAAEPLPEPGPPPAYEPPPPIPTPILPAVTVALDDLVRIERAWRQEIQNIIIPELERTMRKAADAVLKDIAFEAPVLWDVSQPSAQAFLTQTKNQLVGVGEDMWMRTRDQLIMGMQDGDSIQQLSARVKEVLGTTDTRARAIARTEVIGASNAGAMQQLELLGEDAPARKTWLATRDGRTRLSHAAANGQTVDFVAPFTVGGAKFDYPGDPDAPASERVNCRCTLVWHFDDLPLKTSVPIRSAGVLEMFHLKGKHNQHDHAHGSRSGGDSPGGGGSKKVLKPANVDTSRLNAAEAKELADIEADFAAGNIDAAKYKYKTYYVKVKASKRINKSGGAGKGTELDTKVTPDKKPGADLKNGDVVKLPSGKTGVIVGQTEVSATVETPDGDSFVFNKGKLKKADSEPKVSVAPSSGFKDVKPLGPAVNDGDSVNTPGGPGKVLKQNSKGVLVEHADGGQDVYDAGSVTKQPAMPGVGGAKSGSPVAIKKGDTVDTP
ncbi:MAG TPA: phage minor head protein, partial [Nitrospira sp.]|nr:phage minor head protein [Nitrospira sp.]